ncbi:MAG: hypothetical protein J5736_03380, partial [Bacilli bacterium]|nr:hypothetical protein [Bacilli bacterium]
MKRKTFLSSMLLLAALTLAGCGPAEESSGDNSSGNDISSTGGDPASEVPSTISSHDANETQAYMDQLYANSQNGHLYYHYLRYDNTPASYAGWDVWAWQMSPMAGEGTRFNWVGRTTNQS